jgi:hypothetical protein
MRTARSRTSGENLFVFFMAPSSQRLEPPRNPGQFRTQKGAAPGGQSCDVLAIEIAKFAETSDDKIFYDGIKPRGARADALGGLFNQHSEAILNEFTDFADPTPEHRKVTMESEIDRIQLANLMRLTAMNPDYSKNSESMQKLESFFDQQVTTANSTDATPDQKAAAEWRLSAFIRAQVLVPAQAFADLKEQDETTTSFYNFAVKQLAKVLTYGSGKIPVPGVDAAAKWVVKVGAKAVNAEIDDRVWKDLDSFLAQLQNSVENYHSVSATLKNFGLLDDVQLQIDSVRAALSSRNYKALLHSKDVPGTTDDSSSIAVNGAASSKSAKGTAPATAVTTTPSTTVAQRAPSHLKIVDVSQARSSGVAFNPDFQAMPTPQPGKEMTSVDVEIHAGEELARDLGLGDTAKQQPTRQALPKPLDPKEPVFVRDPKIFLSGGSGGDYRMPDWLVYQKGQPVLAVEATKDSDFEIKPSKTSKYGSHKGSQLPETILGLINTFGSDRPIQYVIRSPSEPGPNAKDVLASVDALLKKDAKYANVTVTWVAG